MAKLENRAISLGDVLRTQGRVIHALMLRDVKSRLFGNGLGFIFFSVGWPLVHILVLLGTYSLMGRAAPYGESLALFFAVGLVPFMTFNYMSRWIMLSLIMNKPLLSFPIVKVTDILIARAFLEMLGSCMMTALYDLLVFGHRLYATGCRPSVVRLGSLPHARLWHGDDQCHYRHGFLQPVMPC